jgi:AAA ATPase domain/AAA domain, putative AbiEii toxin, Type IV TA system
MLNRIQSVSIRGFRQIDNVEIKMSNPTFLIGGNGSGKTTILESLKLLQQIVVCGVSAPFESTFADVKRENSAADRELSFCITATLPSPCGKSNGTFTFLLTLGFPKDGSVAITSEGLTYSQVWDEITTIDPSAPPPSGSLSLTSESGDIPDATKQLHKNVIKFFSKWVFTGIISSKSLQAVPPPLTTLCEEANKLRLHYLLPDPSEHTTVWLERIMSLLTTLYMGDDPPYVVFIEEIENGISPVSLTLLITELLSPSSPAQVVATTHSPHLLDMLTLQQIICVKNTVGKITSWRPSDTPGMEKWEQALTPGGIWMAGGFDG